MAGLSLPDSDVVSETLRNWGQWDETTDMSDAARWSSVRKRLNLSGSVTSGSLRATYISVLERLSSGAVAKVKVKFDGSKAGALDDRQYKYMVVVTKIAG